MTPLYVTMVYLTRSSVSVIFFSMNTFSRVLYDLFDTIRFDVLNMPLPESQDFSIDKLSMKFKLHKDDGGFWLESAEYPGLIASGETPEELREAVFDSILTYFDVPRARAKRMKDILVLNLPGGKVINPPESPFFQIHVVRA